MHQGYHWRRDEDDDGTLIPVLLTIAFAGLIVVLATVAMAACA